MIRLLLVDDHVLVRTGLKMLLAQQTDMMCVGEASTGDEGLELVRRTRPDVVLCDLHLPGLSGLELTERIARMPQGPRVVAVSVQDDGPLPRRVLEAGASGYVSKGSPANELLRAVRDVARGKRYVGSDIAQGLALGRLRGSDRSPFDVLSPRELEIAMMLVQGMRMADIARKLNLSPKTISTHKYRLLEKLDIEDTLTLARLASQHGLVDPARSLQQSVASRSTPQSVPQP